VAKKRRICYPELVPDIRPCIVSYTDAAGVTHSVQVNAATVFEAAITGMAAMKVSNWRNDPALSIRVRLKAPARSYAVGTAVLVKWLSRQGKTPREVALKVKLSEMMKKTV